MTVTSSCREILVMRNIPVVKNANDFSCCERQLVVLDGLEVIQCTNLVTCHRYHHHHHHHHQYF